MGFSIKKKEGLEELRTQVEEAKGAAARNRLYALDNPELLQMLEGHELGANANGWKNPYPESDPRSLLLEYQFDIFHDRSRFKSTLMSRQAGKDFTMQGEIVADCNARKTEWMIAAPSERQAIDSLDQGKIWAKAFDLEIADVFEERFGPTSQSLLKSLEIEYSNGSRERAVPGRPDTVRGRSANLGFTEMDFFEKPTDTWRACLPSIINPLRGGEKIVRVVSTPNGKGGQMFKIHDKPDGKAMKWSKRLVNIYHAVLMGLPVDIEALREALDDPEGFDQECLCLFLDGASVLLPYEVIALAESFEATEHADPDFWDASGTDCCMGIDFGRTNDPTVAWTTDEVGDLSITREVLVLKNMSTPAQVRELERRIRRCSRVCLDYTGPGIGFGDYLVEQFGEWKPSEHKFGKIELFTFTAKSKRLLFPKLRSAFNPPNNFLVPVSTEIREDLHQMQQIVRNAEYTYTAKRTAEGHSDRCTAAALNRRAKGTEGRPLTATILGADGRPATGEQPSDFERAFADVI